MSFFSGFFRNEKPAKSVVLIDIGTDSVPGAYAHYVEGEKPVLLYTQRLPIQIRKGEFPEHTMLHTLKVLGATLILEGAPTLMRATGSGHSDTILVSVDAPWQTTSVRTEHFERQTPFVFTRSMTITALQKTGVTPPGKLLADESIIGTILNGYETRDPYWKKVHRASVIVLTSFIDEPVAAGIAATLQGLYHTKDSMLIAGSSLRYQAMRTAFPHERDALILDATGSVTSIALVRKDLFVALAEVSDGVTGSDDWIRKIASEFSKFQERYPLPRTVFLLAEESKIPSLQKILGSMYNGKLRLSSSSSKIVPVFANHILGLIQQTSTTPPDLQLLLMTLFWQHHASEEKDLIHSDHPSLR